MRILIVVPVLLAFTSCSTRYIQQVPSDTKTKFGFAITGPNKAVYFVENEKINHSKPNNHAQLANALYNAYGPARDDFYVANTNDLDFKFNLADKTYYIAVENLPKRTAMILFDGKHKPIVAFNPRRYNKLISKIK